MIFNGKYIDLELTQINSDANHATIQIGIKRTNPYYYNREGIIVQISEGENMVTEDKWIFFTAYDPKSIVKKGYVGSDTPVEVEANYFEQSIEYTIDPVLGQNKKRRGTKTIFVRLIENTSDERSEIYAQGSFELKTLEVPLPSIHDIEITFSSTEIYKKVTALNPQGLYTLSLLSSHEGGITLDPVNLDHTSTIQTHWRGEVITYVARFTLGTAFITEKVVEVPVPSDNLHTFIKENDEWYEADAIYETDSEGNHNPALSVWFKNAGEWTTQD